MTTVWSNSLAARARVLADPGVQCNEHACLARVHNGGLGDMYVRTSFIEAFFNDMQGLTMYLPFSLVDNCSVFRRATAPPRAGAFSASLLRPPSFDQDLIT
uniref:Uncharacterized protein n=1 Tax=Noctiluca scintillans TaxID=2966 RepID=A0A7S1A5R7_NOCSC